MADNKVEEKIKIDKEKFPKTRPTPSCWRQSQPMRFKHHQYRRAFSLEWPGRQMLGRDIDIINFFQQK